MVCVVFGFIIFGTNTGDAVDKTLKIIYLSGIIYFKWEIRQFFGIDRNIWPIFSNRGEVSVKVQSEKEAAGSL